MMKFNKKKIVQLPHEKVQHTQNLRQKISPYLIHGTSATQNTTKITINKLKII